MDANDLYNKISDGDSYGHIRPFVDELAAGDTALTEDERTFVRGVQASMALDMPLGVKSEHRVRELCVQLRQRLHAGS